MLCLPKRAVIDMVSMKTLLEYLDARDTDKIKTMRFSDVTKLQRELYEYYCTKDVRCKDPDYIMHQMVTAIIDEYIEYVEWCKQQDYIEAMFEAIDLYHFALEGLIVTQPYLTNKTPHTVYTHDRKIMQKCSEILNDINWKHWKKPEQRTHESASLAFNDLCDMAYTLFAEACQAQYGDGKMLDDIELIDRSFVSQKFFIYYYAKNKENFERQQRGY